MLRALQKIVGGEDLSRQEAADAMEEILSGRATDAQIGGLLTALRVRGETVEQLVGFASVMRRHVTPIFREGEHRLAQETLVDTCGTGGDAAATFNVSTAAAFVAAGAGARVAKHGNRSISSRAGSASADVMEALGVRLDLPPQRMGQAIEQVGIGFLFAPALHPAMRYAMRARTELKMRTVFNLLGPLTNPAGAAAQVVGVYDANLVETLAHALAELGSKHAFVVHGAGGLDEISLSGETRVGEVREGTVRLYSVAPETFELARAPLSALAGGGATTNAETIRSILAGEAGPRRDIVLANASAALVAVGLADDFAAGARLGAQAIDTGAAQAKLDALVAFTNEQPAGVATN